MRLSDDHSLARGRGKGTVSQNMHDVQVKQIEIAAGETTEKVCMVTPRTRHLRGHAPRKLCTKLLLAWVMFRPVDRDVFVRDLNRQLGTPSHWLPVDS